MSTIRFIKRILSHPQAGELLRFLFLGSVVETGRAFVQKIPGYLSSFFMVKAHFPRGDASYEWVTTYLQHHGVWSQSAELIVMAQDTSKIKDRDVPFRSDDGYLDAVYDPTWWTPELFHWNERHWITVCMDKTGLIIEVWGWNRTVLDAFILAARDFYQNRTVPHPIVSGSLKFSPTSTQFGQSASARPPMITGSHGYIQSGSHQDYDFSEPQPVVPGSWGSLVSGIFQPGDFSYTWIYEFVQYQDYVTANNQVYMSTRQSDSHWGREENTNKQYIYAIPSNTLRFRWNSYWVQADLPTTQSNGAGISPLVVIIHSCDISVLMQFVEASHAHYKEASISRVNVHLAEYNRWGRVIAKTRRSFSTLILPDGEKENLLFDVQEFLDNENWLSPFGEPGTGKSTTVHALAGELGMEIYFVSLASPGINDHTLGELFHTTPPHSILLIEDIDCAFQSRTDDSNNLTFNAFNIDAGGYPVVGPGTAVTLSGLLNILDSVASQEGRILFATTNHIERLDPALIRPGRIDVKIKYSLATKEQLENVFDWFYPLDNMPASREALGLSTSTEPWADVDMSETQNLARQFAAAIPESKFSIAQLQGYVLGWKNNPMGAVQGIAAWVEDQDAQVRDIYELQHGKTADTM
ncbi:P-loop containing nucleoside triphosphate hydrolase protein [Mycena crocata]|nr:P-loop containing nucleoside triphosphate hydrolase protein [Mycena crocata]